MNPTGGYFVQDFSIRHPQLVSGLAILSGMIDSQESVAAARSRIPELSSWAQKVIRECEEKDDYENEDYQKASMVGSPFSVGSRHRLSRPMRLSICCNYRTVFYLDLSNLSVTSSERYVGVPLPLRGGFRDRSRRSA